jgi:hypothetical protein
MWLPGDAPSKKMAALVAPPSFREETSKKADSAARGRIAAVHKLNRRSFVNK